VAKKDAYRVLYDFGGQSANELSLKKDEIIEIIRKEENGKLFHHFLMPSSLELYRKNADRNAKVGGLSSSLPKRIPAGRHPPTWSKKYPTPHHPPQLQRQQPVPYLYLHQLLQQTPTA